MKIILDAMGGDNAPQAVVQGALEAHAQCGADIVLVGREEAIRACLTGPLPEGDLTRIRAALVCEQSLHEVAQKLNLGSYLKLGKGEEAGGGRHRASILADATEAVFAAVYLDGGITAASELIHRVLLDVEREEVVEERRRDYKTLLQEHIQRKAGQELTYCMVREEGPDHAKTFVTEVRLNGAAIGEGSGHSKKESEQMAAKSALEKLDNQ